MQIGELSERTGVSVRMLRYYETLGLLNPARTPSGYRNYGTSDVDTVSRVLVLNKAGIALSSVSSLLSCVNTKSTALPPCDALKSKVYDQLQQIERQMSALTETHRLLSNLLQP